MEEQVINKFQGKGWNINYLSIKGLFIIHREGVGPYLLWGGVGSVKFETSKKFLRVL